MNNGDRILVIDREPEWRAFVAEVLRKAGYAVSAHRDVSSALAEILQQTTDLLLTDATLQELINKLATEYTAVPFIVFTTSPSVGEAITVYRRGALDYESKSFDPGFVLAVVREALGKDPVQSPRFM